MKASSVSLPMIESGKVENRFAERFAGNRAMMNADAADAAGAIDNRDSLAKFRALDRGFCPAGTEPITAKSYCRFTGASVTRPLMKLCKINMKLSLTFL
jgi:hypothetical protein